MNTPTDESTDKPTTSTSTPPDGLWITTTPLAPDGELHIGRLAGPYVAADVLARFLRADGRPALLTTGTADHRSSVEVRAQRGGREPGQVADSFRAAIVADWRRSGVAFDRVVRPLRDRSYRAGLVRLFKKLYEEGALVPRTRALPHCEPCARTLHGAHVRGGCPHCGAVSGAGVCRACARPHHGGDLTDPVCVRCGAAAVPKETRGLWLPLEPLREQLVEHWAAAALPPRLAAYCERLAAGGLPEIAVTNPGAWGVPVPVEGFTDQRIDAVFEDAVMQVVAHGGLGPSGPALPQQALHFGGFGHALGPVVLLPAVLIALGVKPVQRTLVNWTYRVDDAPGRHGAWALDLLNEYGSDTVRRHVVETWPLGRSTVFREVGLHRTRQVLDEEWNGWLRTLFAAVEEGSGGVVPAAAAGGAGWRALTARLHACARELRVAYEADTFDPRGAVPVLDAVVRGAAEFGRMHRSAPGGPQQEVLTGQLAVAAALAAWSWPLMPEGAGRLAAALGIEAGAPVTAEALTAPPAGTRIVAPGAPVFAF
ncbi:class I tRNA ligase family protein [Streptomyces sp. TRM66268-LWL]|uniref:Class I tRNA ligase family protein n=1 Tax=Streptomyces polyasparticus TaxID=2767826 RepID=A0ABR7SM09_9ACTN|nr:class I tRNA ligase family protein [Streptomyces polyasparticus]MBC9716521.1 class I tRNA ligase family protein [Streptomyces polyasparticus]